MANTTNLNMVKPAGTDHALISVINSNMDIIDGAVGALPSGSTLQGEIDSANTAITTLDGKILKTTGTYSGLTWKLSGVNNMTYLTINGTTNAAIAQWAFFNIGITHGGHETIQVSGTPENTFQFNANGDIKFTRAIASGTTINAVFIVSTDFALSTRWVKAVEITGTMPSSVNTLTKIADFPAGYSEDSSFIVGYITRHINNTWYSNVAAVSIMTTSGQGIRAQTSDSNFVGTAVKVYLGKLA